MSWIPHITVAAVVERDGKFLLVEESVENNAVYNQPAGHLEENESLLEAVVRETLEETAMEFTPEHLLGVYQWKQAHSRETYIRVAFAGSVNETRRKQPLRKGILGTAWLSYRQVLSLPENRLRSSMVRCCMESYLSGVRYPLSAVFYLNEGS